MALADELRAERERRRKRAQLLEKTSGQAQPINPQQFVGQFMSDVQAQPSPSPPPQQQEPTIGGIPTQEIAQLPGAQAVTALGRRAGEFVFGDAGGAGFGELAGRGVGGVLGGPPGAAVGGGLGAAAGLGISRLARGESVTPGELAIEMGMTVLPDAVIRGGGAAVRRIASGTRPGREAASDVLARQLRDNAERFFEPIQRAEAERLFDLVRASGDKLTPGTLTKPLKGLTDTQFKHISQALTRMQAPPGKSGEAFGEGVAKVFADIRGGAEAPGLDLGTLQHVRSQVQKRALRTQDGATKDALQEAIEIIDDAVEKGNFSGGGGSVEMLKQARRLWAKAKDADDFAAFINSRSITSTSAGGRTISINAGKLADDLANPRGKLAERAARALDKNPAAKIEIEEFLKNVKRINIDPGNTEGSFLVNGLAAALGAGSLSRVRLARMLQDAPTKGQLAEDGVILLMNAARRRATEFGLLERPTLE